jgi:adenylate kinase family enzyme
MSKPRGIIILGANGSGKTTLGRELARMLNFTHFDAEDYYWYKTDMPFTVARSQIERQKMLLSDIEKHGSFVMSGDVSNWGEQFITLFDFVIFLKVPTDIRIERIERREFERFGDRIQEGGDMYEQHIMFVEFAATRSIALLEQWALLYSCPILHVDGTKTPEEIASKIIEHIKGG